MKGSLQIGQYVRALAGRDKPKVFIVVGIDGEYAYIADGKTRKIAAPKKKKVIHLQKYNRVSEEVRDRSENDEELTDSLIRRELEGYV